VCATEFVPDAWDAYLYWQSQGCKTLKRINALIQDAAREPFAGLGKPEPLRGHLSGYWSRRIDDTHRLVYRATESTLVIVACRFHYEAGRMQRELQGRYVTISTVGEKAQAFVPAPMPPRPPIDWTPELRGKFDEALLALRCTEKQNP
jgi:toxin YoeB